jgi:NhaA family Na+:H+ antiporter
MVIFFFLVGLEIKREILEGELNSLSKFALPGFAAVGGMVIPAIIYAAFNSHHPASLQGWAIPTATDIAFALGILSLLGSRVPVSLKIFLTALAILDDLGAIVIIAIFYTKNISAISLALAGVCMILLLILNLMGVRRIGAYVLVGIIMWICVLKSGIHATLAGVILAMAIPLRDEKDPTISPLRNIEHGLHPWVAFLVLPVFAFFNAGVSYDGISLSTFVHPIPLGIGLGLFLGKQIGVFGAAWLAVKSNFAKLPQGASWSWIYGISLLCGVGFTMSLFIGTLAFNGADQTNAVLVRFGVLVGSFASGLLGYLVLFGKSKKANQQIA